MEKMVKVRKVHTCGFCNRPILKGETAHFWSIRGPEFDRHDIQIGIRYSSGYMCQKPDCEEVGNEIINYVIE